MGRLRECSRELAKAMAAELSQRHPDWTTRSGAEGAGQTAEDFEFHLRFLVAAAEARRPQLFGDYIDWAATLLAPKGVGFELLVEALSVMRWVLRRELPGPEFQATLPALDAGLNLLGTVPPESQSLLPGSPLQHLAVPFLNHLLHGDRASASALILQAADDGVPIRDIYLHIFQRTQWEIGRLWHLSRITVAQEHYCTAATQLIMSQLYPRIFGAPRNGKRLVAACIGGDLHEIGIRMVTDFLEMEGWDTYYLGANAPTQALIDAVKAQRSHLVAISVTLTPHLDAARQTIQALRADPACRDVRILIGGCPFNANPGLWREFGADATAGDAAGALAAARRLVGEQEGAGVQRGATC